MVNFDVGQFTLVMSSTLVVRSGSDSPQLSFSLALYAYKNGPAREGSNDVFYQ